MADQLDLRDLRYFETIAETGHVGRAAKKLFRTQPALTGAVRRLEETLGTPLFERVGRGIRLTAAGTALHARARALRVASEETVREIGELGKGLAGLVRIGAVPTVARFLLPPLCREFLKEAPRVKFKTVIGHNDVLRSLLRAGDLDVAVSFSARAEEEITAHAFLEDDCVVVASRAHPIFRKKARMQDLLDYSWVLAGPTAATREWLEHAFHSRGLRGPSVQIETNLILLLPALIEQNKLLSFISRRHLKRGAPLKEVPLKETTMRRHFVVAHRKASYLSPAATRCVEMLRTRGKQLFEES
jgi:DNA-binding transcriptional LysR family regulator